MKKNNKNIGDNIFKNNSRWSFGGNVFKNFENILINLSTL